MRVGYFTDRSDYNSLVKKLDFSSDAHADKDKNKFSFIISDLEDVGLSFSKNSSVNFKVTCLNDAAYWTTLF